MKRKDLRKMVSGFREGILANKTSANMCFAVSGALEGYLQSCGVRCHLVKGEVGEHEHYWVNLMDVGDIIDATADQFSRPNGTPMPKVYIGVQPYWYKVCEGKE